MVPFLVLVIATLALRAAGRMGVHPLDSWTVALRAGLALMFLLTASAHWGKRRRDLVARVPRAVPRPDLMVTITGLLEILGAAGLLLPQTARAAAICLAVLLLALFPANVRAARQHLKIGDASATPLPLRTILQIVFIAALVVAAFPSAFGLAKFSRRLVQPVRRMPANRAPLSRRMRCVVPGSGLRFQFPRS